MELTRPEILAEAVEPLIRGERVRDKAGSSGGGRLLEGGDWRLRVLK